MDDLPFDDRPSLRALFPDRSWPRGPAVPADWLRNRVVLVTGAGGSLGSLLVRRLCRTAVRAIIAVDAGEHQLVRLQNRLQEDGASEGGPPVRCVLANLRCVPDRRRSLNAVPDGTDPDLAIHAAAYKHVPFLEDRPRAAAANNVLATVDWARACQRAGVDDFVFVSTDKAARPTSVMGQTKRWAERWLRAASREGDAAPPVTVARLCNVFGSRGSVVPFFLRRLRSERPLPVTHRAMRRWMMTPRDAIRTTLAVAERPTGTYVPDACLEVGIPTLARRLIRWARPGATPDDWIQWTEPRSGEQLQEARWGDEETVTSVEETPLRRLESPLRKRPGDLESLRQACAAGDTDAVRRLLRAGAIVEPSPPSVPPASSARATGGSEDK